MKEEVVFVPATIADNESQKASLAELPKLQRFAHYERLLRKKLSADASADSSAESEPNYDLSIYHSISCMPITKAAEDDMEMVSDIFDWGERYLHHFEVGVYRCSRCRRALYSSEDKYQGPCVWPSFRKAFSEDALHTRVVAPYNKYTVTVKEVYCGGCDLFIGHQFEDGKEKGDTHPEAHWRQ